MELSEHAQFAKDIALEPRAADCPVPMTAGQLRAWNDLIKQGRPLSVRMCANSLRVLGPLDIGLMRRSIEAEVQRHESLRTRIVPVAGVPRQHIDAPCQEHFEVIDVTKVSPTHGEREAKRVAQEFADEKIDLSAGRLFEAKLLRLSDREHVLILALDHIVSDGVSYVILNKEIWTLYNQAAHGREFSLPQLPIQFADYAVWQQRTYDTWLTKHEAYWRGRLTGAPRVQLPRDDGLVEMTDPVGEFLHIPLGKRLTARLRDLARRERTLLSLVILTIYIAVISRWCNQRDFVLTFASHGRHSRLELENMIGLLVNFLHFRMELTQGESFLDLLKRAKLEFYSACQHQDFNRVPEFLPECTTELYFNWQPANWTRASVDNRQDADDALRMQPFPLKAARSVRFLPVFLPVFYDTAAGVCVSVGYRPDLLRKTTIERFGRNLRLFAAEFAQRPLASIASVPLAT